MRTARHVVAGRYQIERHIGSGGMGEVYLATDAVLGRRVAVKVLPADAQGDPTARERLRREARAAAALDHPFICKIHEVGEADGQSFIVMEFIDGDTLHQLAASTTLPVRQVLDIAHALSQALEEAHNRGITHRDLKPGNIMVTRQGHVKVLDFGLAKQAGGSTAADATGGGTILTDPGTRVGTPAYMSPEQILGGSVDPRSDIFSLGVILHEIVSGEHPFRRDTPADTMAAVLRDPPSTTGRDLEAVPGLRDVIHRMLSKACAERYQTMAELRAELESLRERSWQSTPSAGIPTAARAGLPAERTPFVAREAEFTELRRALDHMLLGQGGIVLIGGEPGVGKTRLVRELQREARQRGCLTLTGHCYEMEGSPPFVPFVEYMEEAARLVPQAFRVALGDEAGEIAAIVPGLRRMYSDLPPPLDVPPDQQRRISFNAFLEFLQRGTRKSPSVLLFDDLHWADEPTLQLLQHLAPHLATMRTLLVGTYRDVELDVKKPFARTLESLVRQRLARRITLRRLAVQDVEEMLTKMSGAPAPSSVVRVVFQETEGNAFFVEEVYQHLSEEGRLFDDQGNWRDDLGKDTLNVPESVKLVIGRRLERLGDEARKILTAAAVIGRTFPLDLLQAIVDADADAVLDLVEEAERATLLTAHPGREARYGFVHELIRTTLISGLSLPRRQRLHLKIADAIERLRGNGIDPHLPALAHHLYQSGAAADLGRTAATLVRAARQALGSGGFEEALEVSDNLLSLELPASDPLRANGVECKGQALMALRRSAEARAALDEAFTLYANLQDVDGIERTTIAAGISLGWGGHLEEACRVYDRGLAHLPPTSQRARIAIKADSILPLTGLSEMEQAHHAIEDIVTASSDLRDQKLVATVLSAKAVLERTTSQFRDQLQSSTRALALLPSDAYWLRADAGWSQAYAYYYNGRFADAEAAAASTELDARRVSHHGALWALSLIRALMRLMRSGNLAGALADYQTISNERWDFVTELQTAMFTMYLGRTDKGLALLRTAAANQPGRNFLSGTGSAALFAATALTGDVAGARQLLEDAVAWLPRDGALNAQGRWSALMSVVNGLALLGDREGVARLDPLASRLAANGMPVDTLSFGPNNGDLCAAITAAATADEARAECHFERALAISRELPNKLLEPNVLYWRARFEFDRRRSDAARPLLQSACDQFAALGMVLHRDRAARALDES